MRCSIKFTCFLYRFVVQITALYTNISSTLVQCIVQCNCSSSICKGRMASPKLMNFRKSSKRPLTPPPSFSENHVALFATKLRQKCVCSVWRDCCVLYDPISHEMHVVQQFNMVLPLNWLKTYPKKTLLYHFHAEKALFKVQNLQHKFLDWKWPPPPFGTFPKIHPFWLSINHPDL